MYNDEDGYVDSQVGGERIKTRQYKDGRTTYHFGGPVGSVTYNKYGEECNPQKTEDRILVRSPLDFL